MKKHNLFIESTRLLFGSWWSILGHTMLFIVILFLSNDLLFFNTFVSIEAIYIGILILMAEFREQADKEKLDEHRHTADRQLVKEDVNLTQDVISEIQTIKKHQAVTSKALEEIREVLSKK